MHKNLVSTVLFSLIVSHSAFAKDLTIVGESEHVIALTHANKSLNSASKTKPVTLFQIKLSDHAKNILHKRVINSLERNANKVTAQTTPLNLPKNLQLGMNKVPVLDQGQHGTCVTFAVSAAIDAALNKGDYVSQLCSLQLGRYFENHNGQLSGWDGLWGDIALDRIARFGVMNLKDQRKYGCGGVKEYPYYSTPYTEMSVEDYLQQSENLSEQVTWKTLFNEQEVTTETTDSYKNVNDVKAALNEGMRVSFGVLLPRTDLGTVGAVGWHHYFSDTWVLSYDIAQELEYSQSFPGHEMVVTGYDDNAIAMDNYGHRHYGLLTLRNSWGSMVADWGDFYMSYDYFNALAIEAYKIGPVKQ